MRIEVRDLVVDRGSVRAVDRISLAIEAGSWMGVIGANGSGKTSLLRALAGRAEASSGNIVAEGMDRAGDRGWRARYFGFAPDAAALPASLTGRELFSIVGRGRSDDGTRHALTGLRTALAFDRFIDRRIGSLSAGMRQRLAIFCAFLDAPRVALLDEPFNWLDPVCAYDTRAALRALVDQQGVTLVTALHETATLLHHCDTGILMSDGKVARSLSGEDLRAGAGDYGRFEAELIAALRQDR